MSDDFRSDEIGETHMVQEPRKIMRLPQVMAVTGWSRSTVYDKIKAGKFPKPFKPDPDGRVAGWFEDEVAELQRRAIERNAAAA
jgi:prophage regulatory protein